MLEQQKLIIIINGKGGCGKDTLIKALADSGRLDWVDNVSSITPVVEYLKLIKGIDVSRFKKDEVRALLDEEKKNREQDIKDYIDKEIENYVIDNRYERSIMFIQARQPRDIERTSYAIKYYNKNYYDNTCKSVTLLISSNRTDDKIYGDEADDNVNNYNYDYEFRNDGSIEEETERFINYIEDIFDIEAISKPNLRERRGKTVEKDGKKTVYLDENEAVKFKIIDELGYPILFATKYLWDEAPLDISFAAYSCDDGQILLERKHITDPYKLIPTIIELGVQIKPDGTFFVQDKSNRYIMRTGISGYLAQNPNEKFDNKPIRNVFDLAQMMITYKNEYDQLYPVLLDHTIYNTIGKNADDHYASKNTNVSIEDKYNKLKGYCIKLCTDYDKLECLNKIHTWVIIVLIVFILIFLILWLRT